jgi:hypothetical protein
MSEALTAEQKKALFEAYDKQRAKMLAASAMLDTAVRNIAESLGTGPFRWLGSELTIAKRGERLIMKGKSDKDLQEIG